MATQKIRVCSTSEVSPGNQKMVTVNRMPIGIFQVDGEYHALLSICPHRGASLCEGPQCGTTLPTDSYDFVYGNDEKVLRCAWHGWEFDIKSGEFLVDPKVKARHFDVSVEGDDLYVHL